MMQQILTLEEKTVKLERVKSLVICLDLALDSNTGMMSTEHLSSCLGVIEDSLGSIIEEIDDLSNVMISIAKGEC